LLLGLPPSAMSHRTSVPNASAAQRRRSGPKRTVVIDRPVSNVSAVKTRPSPGGSGFDEVVNRARKGLSAAPSLALTSVEPRIS
jgi:hypothetical protein